MIDIKLRSLQHNRILASLNSGPQQAGMQMDRILRAEILKAGPRLIDSPCRTAEEDEFEFGELAQNLFNTVQNDNLETPFTLCIDGQWGAGKSSLARIIHSKFTEDSVIQKGCLAVWIDTSLVFDGAGVLSFLAETTLAEAVHLAQRISTDPTKKGKYGDHVMPLAPITHDLGDGFVPSEEAKARSVMRTCAKSWLEEWQGQIGTRWDLAKFRKLVTTIRFSLLGYGGLARIIWFVDDLDRCRSEIILNMLDIHRSFLEQWGTILVYPMNLQVLESVIEKHFLVQGNVSTPIDEDPHAGAYLEQARTYLEKMFFRRVRPPEPSEGQLTRWLIKLLPEDTYYEGLVEFMRDAYFGNPRYIKKLVASIKFLCERYYAAEKGRYMGWFEISKQPWSRDKNFDQSSFICPCRVLHVVLRANSKA